MNGIDLTNDRGDHGNTVVENSVTNIRTDVGLISTIQAGNSLNAVSSSPDGTSIAAGGRKVYKIFKLGEEGFSVQINFRKKNMNYGVVDLKWHPKYDCAHLIATAPTNGKVVIWNINSRSSGKLEKQYDQHTRTVNSIDWSPKDDAILLSGSQDGTIKLWDIRQPQCAKTFACNSEVRSVKFSPHYNTVFSAGVETGDVQIWDIRQESRCKRIFPAHNGLILTVDWHPMSKNHIATGGRDRVIKLWDMNTVSRPVNQVQTIASVTQLLFRPENPNHLVSCANIMDHNVHLWDLTSPYVPLLTFEGHVNIVTGMLWHKNSPDILVTCGKDGKLMSQPISNAKYPKQKMPVTAVSFNPCSELAFVSEDIDRNQQERNKAQQKSLLSSPVKSQQSTKFNFVETPINGVVKIASNTVHSYSEDFVYFAKNYKFFGGTPVALCAHNMKVADIRGTKDLARMWSLLGHVLTPPNPPSEVVSKINTLPLPQEDEVHRIPDDEDVFLSSYEDNVFDDQKSYEDDIQFLQCQQVPPERVPIHLL
ncbi:GATOR complex protein [Acrasis kona]|uniref:GATOR complex protein n=1 Tax=Acrasis kona TaxID=1008807 RepID=A0AAW2ZPP8_9EUKA